MKSLAQVSRAGESEQRALSPGLSDLQVHLPSPTYTEVPVFWGSYFILPEMAAAGFLCFWAGKGEETDLGCEGEASRSLSMGLGLRGFSNHRDGY